MKTCRKGLHQYEVGIRQCPECEKIWFASKHRKDYMKNYVKTPSGAAAAERAWRKYSTSRKGIEKRSAWARSERGRKSDIASKRHLRNFRRFGLGSKKTQEQVERERWKAKEYYWKNRDRILQWHRDHYAAKTAKFGYGTLGLRAASLAYAATDKPSRPVPCG